MSSQKIIKYNSTDKCYIFQCPHCEIYTQVPINEINCQIFRHGIMKSNGCQVNPHASKEDCDDLIIKNLVYGCCKPFKMYRGTDGSYEYVDICNYI